MFLVTGASGNVGREVVAILQDKGAPVRALHRSRRDELPAGAEVAQGDLNDPDSLAGAFDDVEGVFLLPGYETCRDSCDWPSAAAHASSSCRVRRRIPAT